MAGRTRQKTVIGPLPHSNATISGSERYLCIVTRLLGDLRQLMADGKPGRRTLGDNALLAVDRQPVGGLPTVRTLDLHRVIVLTAFRGVAQRTGVVVPGSHQI